MPGALLDHPCGHFEPEVSEPTGYQVACIGAPWNAVPPSCVISTFEPEDEPLSFSKGNLIFLLGVTEFEHQQGTVLSRCSRRIEIDHPAPSRRVLLSNHAAQSPERGLGKRKTLGSLNRLSPAGHEPQRRNADCSALQCLNQTQSAATTSFGLIENSGIGSIRRE